MILGVLAVAVGMMMAARWVAEKVVRHMNSGE
jgi:hypothetical protein